MQKESARPFNTYDNQYIGEWMNSARTIVIALSILTFTGLACSDNGPVEVDDGSLEAQIRALYPAGSSARDDATTRLAAIRQQVTAGNNAAVRSQTLTLVDITLKAFQAGQLTGGISTSTGNAVSKFVAGLYQLAGMTPPTIPDGTLGGDGTAQVVGPAGGTVVTPAGVAGVVIPPGALPEQVVVTVERLVAGTTPGAGPLPTSLKQYPPYYEYATYPAVPQFGDSVRVGICQVTDPSSPFYAPEPHERLRLAHGVGASVEVLDRVDPSDFLKCTGVSANSVTSRSGWMGMVASVVNSAAGMVRPTVAYAAHGGLGGKVKSFSPFGAVDPGASGVTDRLASNYDTFCALDPTNAAYCWGDGYAAGLGKAFETSTVPTPQKVATSITFAGLVGGAGEMCGLTSTGTLYCWGDDQNAQYGYAPDTVASFTPKLAAAGLSFSWVSPGGFHVCGIVFSGATFCWGENGSGNIGNGDLSRFLTPPVRVATSLTFTKVFAGYQHTCALTAAGKAYCWGLGVNGELGDGLNTSSATPVAVGGGLTFKKLAVGFSYSCGIATDGTYCWGRNRFGTLGVDTGICTNQGAQNALCPSAVPLKVSTSQTFVDITAKERVTCAVTSSAAAYCWGNNAFGELGTGTTSVNPVPTPQPVSGGLAFTTIAASQQAVCAATSDGTIYCWGRNNIGQVGQGSTTTAFYTTPQRVTGISLK